MQKHYHYGYIDIWAFSHKFLKIQNLTKILNTDLQLFHLRYFLTFILDFRKNIINFFIASPIHISTFCINLVIFKMSKTETSK